MRKQVSTDSLSHHWQPYAIIKWKETCVSVLIKEKSVFLAKIYECIFLNLVSSKSIGVVHISSFFCIISIYFATFTPHILATLCLVHTTLIFELKVVKWNHYSSSNVWIYEFQCILIMTAEKWGHSTFSSSKYGS